MKTFIKELINSLNDAKFPIIDLKQNVKINGIQQTDDAILYNRAIEIVNEMDIKYSDKYIRRKVLEQVQEEKDVAISQLNDLGYGLGENVGWIFCTDRVPEIGQTVLCLIKKWRGYEMFVGTYNDADKYIHRPHFDWKRNGFPHVIAWMKLPKLPSNIE